MEEANQYEKVLIRHLSDSAVADALHKLVSATLKKYADRIGCVAKKTYDEEMMSLLIGKGACIFARDFDSRINELREEAEKEH